MADAAASPAKSAADETTLLMLMQSEMDRSEASKRTLQESQELMQRETVRFTTMIKLAEEQIERLKDTNSRLQKSLSATESKLEATHKALDDAQANVATLETDLRERTQRSTAAATEQTASIAQLRADNENLKGSLERLRKELQEKSALLTDRQRKGETDERGWFEAKVALEAQLKAKEEELKFLDEVRQKEVLQATTRELDLSRKIRDLTVEEKKVQGEHEALKRSSFEATAALSTENEQLKLKLAKLEGMTKSSERDNFDRLHRLTLELTMLRERAEGEQLSFKEREKALDAQIAKLITDLRVAQAEVNEATSKEADSSKQYVDTVIQLNATRDSLRAHVKQLEAEVEEAKRQLREKHVEHTTYQDEVNRKTAATTRRYDAQLASRDDEIVKLTYELNASASRLVAVEEELAALKRQSEVSGKTHANETAGLKAEVEGYRKSVEQLEHHIRENHAAKALAEQNALLKTQNLQLKNQVAKTNSALANIKVEADISESYRLKIMHEEMESQLLRVNALEKERRMARPLIQDLVEIVQREALADAALARDIEHFYRQFGAGPDPDDE